MKLYATIAIGLLLLAPVAGAATDLPAARAQARAHSKAGDHRACAALLDQIAADKANLQARIDHYNAGCCHAQAGNADAAFRSLGRAVAAGYREVQHLGKDTDLVSLHDDRRWPKLVSSAQAQQDKFLASNNRALYEMYVQDQEDRKGGHAAIDWGKITARDNERRAAVIKLREGKQLKTSADHLHAAMIFQHGPSADDARTAHDLAVRAAELDPGNGQARWLAAAAKDRELMRLGKPQRYATQFRKGGSGQWELYQVDPTVTDEERARWNTPTLAQAQARAAAMNAAPPPKAPPAITPASAPLMSVPAKTEAAR